MILRPATQQDKPGIIQLLKSSLGESMIPKSEGLWHWKHEQNPFGASFVLLAEEDNQLIGVRAFMQWAWEWKGKRYQAIRAVDTATHPEHQGKGIFKKLTLKQLELCKEQGIHFVFNTPNDQSRPGYLKMGWQQQGQMPLKLQPVRPLTTVINIFTQKSSRAPSIPVSDWRKAIDAFIGKTPILPTGIHTVYSMDYLSWRYASNPLFPYYFISDFQHYLLIYRPKEHSRYLELRVTDFYLFESSEAIKHDIGKQLKATAKKMKVDFITISGNIYTEFKPYLGSMGFIPVRPSGPIVTLKDLNMKNNFNELLIVNNWSYSMGDLELF